MKFLRTFRGRLVVILAFLLVLTLTVQFYLNYTAQAANEHVRELEGEALVAGFTLGVNSLTSSDRLRDIAASENQTFFDERVANRIRDIIVIDNDWRVSDSYGEEYLPIPGDDGEIAYRKLEDLNGLPLLLNASRLGEDAKKFPNADRAQVDASLDDEAHAIPIETSVGRWYVMVILKADKQAIAWRAARPLIYTLLILILSTVTTIGLVWHFAAPITNMSEAARRISAGDLRVRVPDDHRQDEMGRLAAQFNEMTAELERKRDIEAKLAEAEKSAVVGRLASAIAHEIRNPLNYINLTLDHLRRKVGPDDIDKKPLFEKLTSQLKEEVARINNLVSDFLRYARPSKVDFQPVDLRAVIVDSLRLIEAHPNADDIKIELSCEPNLPKVSGNVELLGSIFNNLFINAAQAMEPSGGTVHISSFPDASWITTEITDTGVGIAGEDLDKVFEPYFSTKETGSGLGLAIVKKIVDDHRGSIEVSSKLGEGTKFILKLPLSTPNPG